MKKTILTSLFLLPYFCISQFSTPEVYGEIAGFYEEEFEPSPNTYLKLSAGLQLFTYKFIAPEIDVSYYTGGDEDNRHGFNDMLEVDYRSSLYRNANAVIWGFAPKLFYANEEFRLVFIPKWNFGQVNASGNFIDSAENKVDLKADSKISFWSFSIGIEGEPWNNSPNMGFYLTYTGFNAGKALNKLDFENQGFQKSNYNTKAIGLAIRVGFDFKKNKIK